MAATDQRRPAAALTEETAVEAPSLAGMRVLVVDDEPDARELVSRILLEYGADVVAVNTARDALDRLDAVRPDVIVSDIGLPRSDGYSLIREVRRRPRHAGGDVPALALTAFARSGRSPTRVDGGLPGAPRQAGGAIGTGHAHRQPDRPAGRDARRGALSADNGPAKVAPGFSPANAGPGRPKGLRYITNTNELRV